MICIECPCATFVLQLDQNHGTEDEHCNYSVWNLRLDKIGDLCGAKLFLSLSACIAQWTSCAMVVHVNLANRLKIYKGARITQRPLASWILLGCVNLCSKVNWEDVYVPGIYNTPLCLGRSGSRCQVRQVDTTLVPPLVSFCINQQTPASLPQNNLFHKPASPPANVESDIFKVSID